MPMAEIQDEPSSSSSCSSSSSSNVLLGKYEMGRLLGCGGFAKVYHARHLRTGHSVAVKTVSKHKVELCNLFSHVKREVSIMRRLRHPHIIRLFEVLATRTKIYFIMEFAKGGELFAKVAKARFSEDLSRRYFHQLISAVGYCHSRGVYHRDLKPENLLLDENWSLKISDFGLSAVKEQGMLHTLCGTPAYVAPEILAKRGYDGAKVDIWSCGIILFVLNAGYLPFNDANLMNLYRKIYRGEFRCPKWMSPELRRFLGRLLDTNPETRITVDEIIQDPWFKKGYNYNYNYSCTLKSKIGPGLGLGLVEQQEEEDGDDDENNNNKNEKGSGFITAFDLISYSPGFSLSGLFGVEQRQWQETYVSTEAVETVVGRIEEEARGIDEPKVEVERVKGGMGVSVEAQNGDFGLLIHLHRLTEDLLLVEVNKTDKDDFWKHQLRPRISHLFYQPPPS